jgi:NUMOD3 motif
VLPFPIDLELPRPSSGYLCRPRVIPEYNIQPNASSSAGRILSEEHKAKIAASRKKIIFSKETIVKMSASHMGERNGRFNKGMPVYLYEVTSTLGPQYDASVVS